MADRRLQAAALYTIMDIFIDDDEREQCVVQNRHITTAGLMLCVLNGHLNMRHVPRITGYAENVVHSFTPNEFRYHFRIMPAMFEEVLAAVAPCILSHHGGGKEETDPRKQLLLFLCYLSNQESMRQLSFHFGVSISSVHTIIKRVNQAINETLSNVIQWPDFPAQQIIAREFQLQCGLPDIVGALDGTHIRPAGAPGGDSDYFNRKRFPSMQLQIVTDNDLLIRHAYTGWPGCTHDARVLRNSSLLTNGDQGNYFDQNKYIIGDSAYPLKPWLITPFRDNGHLDANQRRFNRVLSGARQVVERCIGHLKGRFRRLREVTVHDPEDVVKTIISGCILHNLCILNEDNVDDFIDIDDDAHPNLYPNLYRDGEDGAQRRRQLMEALP